VKGERGKDHSTASNQHFSSTTIFVREGYGWRSASTLTQNNHQDRRGIIPRVRFFQEKTMFPWIERARGSGVDGVRGEPETSLQTLNKVKSQEKEVSARRGLLGLGQTEQSNMFKKEAAKEKH